jgi:glycosyltransferase involved in cell wall biosynthesis
VIAVVTSGFPRRSETFALNELLALERAGLLDGVFATKSGDGTAQPGGERLTGRVQVLPPGSPGKQGAALAAALRGRGVSGVHGYFAHLPAEVAEAAARRLGIRFGFGVHARDARRVSGPELAARAARAACVVACNADVAAEVRRAGVAAEVVPHGVDLERFRPRRRAPNGTLRVLAVGRLVEKKGFHVLLDAVARLRSPYRLRIVGEGPERARLGGRTELAGPLTHDELPSEYAAADVVVVPSVADAGGDRDGLPNVVLEAMASGRPVVASDVGAIATAVEGIAGLLVPPGDADALARALDFLGAHPEVRERMGRAARARVELDFDLARCSRRFVRRLEAAYA